MYENVQLLSIAEYLILLKLWLSSEQLHHKLMVYRFMRGTVYDMYVMSLTTYYNHMYRVNKKTQPFFTSTT